MTTLRMCLLVLVGVIAACSQVSPPVDTSGWRGASAPDADVSTDNRQVLRQLVGAEGLTPLLSEPASDLPLFALGRALFFDPILSGNLDQSCAGCHRMDQFTTDGRSLSAGTASVEQGGVRVPGPEHRFTPRNTPALFNLGHPSVRSMFWDRRLENNAQGVVVLHDSAYEATGIERLRYDSDQVSLQTMQAMLPVLVRDEMRGEHGDRDIRGNANILATVSDGDFESVWSLLVDRLMRIDAYREMFALAFVELAPEQLHFQHAARALAHFMEFAFATPGSPWSLFLGGDDTSMDDAQVRGALLFYTDAGCHGCHGGDLLTDDKIHNLGVRPITRGPTETQFVDLGAAHRSHAGAAQRYAFRTPALHNVADTGPWMHNGAYTSLKAAVLHHLDRQRGLREYNRGQLAEEFQDQVHRSQEVIDDIGQTVSDFSLPVRPLSDGEVDDLVRFLHALSAPQGDELMQWIPQEVPSGLQMDGAGASQ